MKLTEAKIEANQANARRSTGPRTEEGKAISSRNSLRHGLTAMTVLLPGEDPAEFQALYDGMHRDFNPLNTTETSLVLELIDLSWRLRRAPVFEARILSSDNPDMKALNNMSLHAARLKRQYSTTLKEFQTMHSVNWRQRKADLDKAAIIDMADQISDRPSTLADHGFDFTIEEIETWVKRKTDFQDARTIISDWELQQPEDEEEEDKAA